MADAIQAVARERWEILGCAATVFRQYAGVRDYLVWSRFPFVRTEHTSEGTAVFFGDARFADGRSASGALQGIRIVVGR